MLLAVGCAAPLVVTVDCPVFGVHGVGERHVTMLSAGCPVMNATHQAEVGVRSLRGRLL